MECSKTGKKRTIIYSSVLACALFAGLAPGTIVSSAAGGANGGVTHTIVAASGTAAPDGGTYNTFTAVSLDAANEVAFDATLRGPSGSGVYVAGQTTATTVALGGNPDPAAANFTFVRNAFMTQNGGVVFTADAGDVFVRKGGRSSALVRNGDAAPDGGTLSPRTYAPNARGAVAYSAGVNGARATQGVFRSDGTNTAAIATDDVAAPLGGTFLSFFDPAINDRGNVAFMAETTGGAADFAVYRGDGSRLTAIMAANQVAPGGATFQDFSDPLINKHGQVAAVGLLTNSASRSGIFVADGARTVAIAIDGQPAPKGGTYTESFSRPLTLNDRGEVAFNAGLRGGINARGVFRGDGERTTVLALTGAPAPGTSGTFASFGDVKLGNDGRVAFIGLLTVGVGGVDASNNMGIWVGRSEADLALVVRTGQVVGGRTLTRLPGGFGQLDMNEQALAWIGTFQSRATGVVLSRIPE